MRSYWIESNGWAEETEEVFFSQQSTAPARENASSL